MNVKELEIYITPDGLGRAAITQRPDGLVCVYEHWKWAHDTRMFSSLKECKSWWDDTTPPITLYENSLPKPGLYGTIEDARQHIRGLSEFSEAVSKPLD